MSDRLLVIIQRVQATVECYLEHLTAYIRMSQNWHYGPVLTLKQHYSTFPKTAKILLLSNLLSELMIINSSPMTPR